MMPYPKDRFRLDKFDPRSRQLFGKDFMKLNPRQKELVRYETGSFGPPRDFRPVKVKGGFFKYLTPRNKVKWRKSLGMIGREMYFDNKKKKWVYPT